MFPENFLKAIANEKELSERELEVLSLTLKSESTKQIGVKLDITEDAVRKRLGEVYKKFQITGRGSGKLSQLQQLIFSRYQEYQGPEGFSSPEEPRLDLQEAPLPLEPSDFYGRTDELNKLIKWIVDDRYRLVTVYGMGGIGKTTVARQLVKDIQHKDIQPKFEFVIWRSLRSAPKLKDFLRDLIQLWEPSEAALPDREDELISQLMEYLRDRRGILVIEDWQMLLSSGELAGVYKDGYEGYGELLRLVAELHHQSCLLLTSWEKPVEMAELLAKTLPVGALQLQGLEAAAARKILKQQGLCDENSWGELIKVYRGNPLALKMVSTTIKELFAGKVSEFIKDTWIFGNMNYFLGKQFKRLSGAESEIMYLLASKEDGLNIQELQDRMGTAVSPQELLAALDSLKSRSLIETSTEASRQAYFQLQPVVMEYVKGLLPEADREDRETQKNIGAIDRATPSVRMKSSA